MQCAFFLAWSLPLVAWLGREAFFASPARRERRDARVGGGRGAARCSASEPRLAGATVARVPTWEDVVEIGTRLPGVEVGTSFRTPALRVRGKGMCRLRTNPDALVLRVVDMGEREALLQGQPDVFFSTPHYDGWPYVLVRLEAVDPVELGELLEDAWRVFAAKRVVQGVGGGAGGRSRAASRSPAIAVWRMSSLRRARFATPPAACASAVAISPRSCCDRVWFCDDLARHASAMAHARPRRRCGE